MTQPICEHLDWFKLTLENGSRFVRMGRLNWAEWMGESLEIVQSQVENQVLEALFGSFPNHEKRD